ncbi:MAG: Hsp20/alpha crystallin family protein [Bacteroidales bacterium]
MNMIKKNSEYTPGYIHYFDDVFGRNWSDLFFGNKNQITIPSVNVADHEKEFSIEVAAPGYNKEDFKISVDNNILTIKADVEKGEEENKKRYAHREYFYSIFERNFTLPENIDTEHIEAKYKHGVLHIVLPKKEVKPKLPTREISIK